MIRLKKCRKCHLLPLKEYRHAGIQTETVGPLFDGAVDVAQRLVFVGLGDAEVIFRCEVYLHAVVERYGQSQGGQGAQRGSVLHLIAHVVHSVHLAAVDAVDCDAGQWCLYLRDWDAASRSFFA